MLILVIDYVVQGHRFDILEDFGCAPVRAPLLVRLFKRQQRLHVDCLYVRRRTIYNLHSSSSYFSCRASVRGYVTFTSYGLPAL